VSARVLVVDDEPQIGRLLTTSLHARGYEVAVATDGQMALEMTATWRPDVVLLDLGLPIIDGLEVCRRVRGWSQVPIIVLTVRDAEPDKVTAFDLGADDYVTKPFGTNELLARIRVALRHGALDSVPDEPILRFGDLTLDLAHRRITIREEDVHLTPTEFELLKVLATQAGKVLTHRMLLQAVWGSNQEQDVGALRVFIAQLRRKIEPKPEQAWYIITEPGIGYRFRVDG
jgi:two-component system, OmpR family, KDP operon response regulator KdpE